MLKTFLTLFVAALPVAAQAIQWQYGDFDSRYKTCALKGWSGAQPTSGKLTIHSTYTHTDGQTYTVYSIAAHALDNLTEVSQITIPASVVEISNVTGKTQTSNSVDNFNNCPKLTKFIVEADNPTFASTGAGLLYTNGLQTLYKVPQALEVTNGAISLSAKTEYVAKDAFSENTTIRELTIPRNCVIRDNGGFNRAQALASFQLSGTATAKLKISSGVLTDVAGTAISCPPALQTASIKLPNNITKICTYAFANTAAVTAVDLTNVDEIGDYAFYKSGITSVKLPADITTTGIGCFQQCSRLKTISYDALKFSIAAHFATDCPLLTKIAADNPPASIGQAAFKNCSLLESFPFSASTNCRADSIFYGCGFTEVIYDEAAAGDNLVGSYMFAYNSKLAVIDASAVDCSNGNSFSIGNNFAPYCLALKTIKMPAQTAFWRYSDGSNQPAFGYQCVLDLIQLGSFWNGGQTSQFCYSSTSSQRTFNPNVYVAVTANKAAFPDDYNSWPLKGIFTEANGATVLANVFADSYSPSKDYVDSHCRYFIPGSCLKNYDEAVTAGCEVRELFGLRFERTGDQLKAVIDRSQIPADVDVQFETVDFGNGDVASLRTVSYATSTTGYSTISKLTINYKVNGVAMSTEYPSAHWLSTSISETISNEDVTIAEDCLLLNSPANYVIYDLRGVVIATGQGNKVTLPAPGSGQYIISLPQLNRTVKIFR